MILRPSLETVLFSHVYGVFFLRSLEDLLDCELDLRDLMDGDEAKLGAVDRPIATLWVLRSCEKGSKSGPGAGANATYLDGYRET